MKNVLGELMEINIIGNEDTKKYLFKCSEVMKILNDTFNYRKYKKGTEYTYVIVGGKKELYLTYKGMLRVLFASNSTTAESFQDWATEKLFTIQMGTQDAKQELAANLLGTDSRVVKKVFSCNTTKTPCVYLICIGKAKDMLKNNTFNDDDFLFKYGCTDDMPRRLAEHEKSYAKEFKTNIGLTYFSIIDTKFIFDAESDISFYLQNFKTTYGDSKELVVINKKDLNNRVKRIYSDIQEKYIGCFKEMGDKIVELEKQIVKLNNDLILKDALHKNELLCEKHKNELQCKEIENLNLKMQMLQMKK